MLYSIYILYTYIYNIYMEWNIIHRILAIKYGILAIKWNICCKNEGKATICNNMGKPGGHYAK